MIYVSSDDYFELGQVAAAIRAHMDKMPELRDVEDTRPLPGIELDLNINRELSSRFGANAQSIGTAVQLVTNGIMVGKYRPDDSQDEVDIRVRYPTQARGIHALDDLRVTTLDGSVVPISNFVSMKPAQQVNSIERVDGHRVYHVRANGMPGVNANAAIGTEPEGCTCAKTLPSERTNAAWPSIPMYSSMSAAGLPAASRTRK
jgi:multidrug efflux pump